MDKLLISQHTINRFLSVALRRHIEIVGLGIGYYNGSEVIVLDIRICRNIARNPQVEFITDPLCIYSVYREAKEKDLDIVAIVHSHPTEPIPTMKDLEGMKLWRIPWIIVDSFTGNYRAWILLGELKELPIYVYA